MAIEVNIINKIEEQLNKYQKDTGATKTWIANKVGITRQRMNDVCKADNLTLETLIKFAIVLKCSVQDLYEYDFKETE